MINVDTNVLIRAFLADDKDQATKAQNLIVKASEKNELFISSYALLEFVWVLKTKKFTREEVYEAVITLVDSTGVIIGQRDVILEAAEKYIKGKADFGDYMILCEGEKSGAHQMATFDQKILSEQTHASSP